MCYSVLKSLGNTNPAPKMNSCYCFTSFVDIDTEKVMTKAKYLIYQCEECPDTGNIHFQGYVEFPRTIRLNAVKKLFDNEALHLEVRRGTQDEAIAYCKKLDSKIAGPWEFGEKKKGQGHRTDWDRIKDDITKLNDFDIANKYPQMIICHPKGMEILKDKLTPPPPVIREVKNIVYYGEPGTGKSRKAHTENPDAYVLCEGNNGSIWFDGYNGEKTLIIDEFTDTWIPYTLFLRMLDPYKLRLQKKGSSCYANWNKIIITTNVHPNNWYLYKREAMNVITRRLHEIYKFTQKEITKEL